LNFNIMSLNRNSNEFTPQLTLHPSAGRWLRMSEALSGLVGICAIVIIRGFRELEPSHLKLLAAAIFAAMLTPLVSVMIRYVWSLTRQTFLHENLANVTCCAIWLVGVLMLTLFGANRGTSQATPFNLLSWTELIVFIRGSYELANLVQRVARAGTNPAFTLVASFVALISVGALVLMLPFCRPSGEPSADWLTALFTSTSACCVTGLVVTDTGTYWSRTGQIVIVILIQLGGLGIMTFGAFFAMVSGRGSMREAATMRDLLESEQLSDVGKLVKSIIGFTLAIELTGAVLLSGLWADQPWPERIFQSLFHSVSAFCNAGFSTRGPSLMGWELRWQVWGVVCALIILGGFGFTPLDNIWRAACTRRWTRCRIALPSSVPTVRLTLSTKIVAVTTLGLLVGGSLLMLGLEWNNSAHSVDGAKAPDTVTQVANAWFHSVTLRTAGFNTIDHGKLTPASKLFGIMLMFVGASPGSTGGGVKTTCLAISILTLRAVLKGRTQVEVWGRSIPEIQVYRGLAVIALGLTVMMIAALGIILIENQPQLVLDYLYESASALGTVGVSTGITAGLQPTSKLILIATMFLGRVGAVTLFVALAGTAAEISYRYPEEKIALG
jgi:trk system potassium uptake protein